MTTMRNSADASFYYHEDATADVARMDSSAVYGNLSDAMKNAILLFPTSEVTDTTMGKSLEVEGSIEGGEKPGGLQ